VFDNCPFTKNADQADLDKDGFGDVCDEDADGDSISIQNDNCPYAANVTQADANANGTGDACETATGVIDSEGDGMPDTQDNCPFVKNPDQADADKDGTGDACDVDIDANANQLNVDVDALGDACDAAATPPPTSAESPVTPASSNSGCALMDDADRGSVTGILAMTGLVLAIALAMRLTTSRSTDL
jgi:hypothetical protein